MNALPENTPQIGAPLQNQNILYALLTGLNGGGQSGRAAADDYQIDCSHCSFPSFGWHA